MASTQDLLAAGTRALELGRVWDAQRCFDAAIELARVDGDAAVRACALEAGKAFILSARPARAMSYYRRLAHEVNASAPLDWRAGTAGTELPTVFFGILPHSSGFVVVPMVPLQILQVRDLQGFASSSLRPNILLPDERFFFSQAVDEFTWLINQQDMDESVLQAFFEHHPDFLLTDQYRTLHPHPVLESAEGGDRLIPDFLLEPVTGPLCDLLEIKRATVPIVVGDHRGGSRWSREVLDGLSQVRRYQRFFDDRENRRRFHVRYGLAAYRPRALLVIGRTPSELDPEARRDVEDGSVGTQVLTYDDILAVVSHRLGTYRRS